MATHTCNPWCFDGLHAVLFDTQIGERGNLEAVARAMAQTAGGEYVGFSDANPPGVRVGVPSQSGVARGRVVVWVRGR
jgi:hypothetical protein